MAKAVIILTDNKRIHTESANVRIDDKPGWVRIFKYDGKKNDLFIPASNIQSILLEYGEEQSNPITQPDQ